MATWTVPAGVLVADLQGIFGARLLSVLVYGPHATDRARGEPVPCLALVASLTCADLEACAQRFRVWTRAELATPLVLPIDEFRDSLDAFPLEYDEVVETHARVFGDDPFEQLTIAPEDMRRACETQVKSHLLHLRENFIEAGGHPEAVSRLVTGSAPAFAALLRRIARLRGSTSGDHATTTAEGARLAGLPDSIVRAILALEQSDPTLGTDTARLFPEYLAAVEQLARNVNAWEPETVQPR